jgi:hypothetical protein
VLKRLEYYDGGETTSTDWEEGPRQRHLDPHAEIEARIQREYRDSLQGEDGVPLDAFRLYRIILTEHELHEISTAERDALLTLLSNSNSHFQFVGPKEKKIPLQKNSPQRQGQISPTEVLPKAA